MNMLSNARKFTSSGGTVVLGAQQLPQEKAGYSSVRFFVRDNGIGMSEEFQSHAFEEFEREKSSTDTGIIGSGLGLAIIRRLTGLMGGSCQLNSKQGKGTEISATISFPVAQTVPQKPGECRRETVDFSGKRVLLVEDNAFNREIARFLLGNMGFAVDEAENGAEAVQAVQQAAPGTFDLVLMDVQMPVMDGYTATRRLRGLKDPVRAGVPVVAMTANAFESDVREALEAGMNAHVPKPIDIAQLGDTLGRLLYKE